MTPLGSIPDAPASQRDTQEAIAVLVKQLGGLKQVVVAGAAANTNIAIAGISTTDVLVGVVEFNPTGPAIADRSSVASITSAGNIRLTVSTASMSLIVTYFDVA